MDDLGSGDSRTNSEASVFMRNSNSWNGQVVLNWRRRIGITTSFMRNTRTFGLPPGLALSSDATQIRKRVIDQFISSLFKLQVIVLRLGSRFAVILFPKYPQPNFEHRQQSVLVLLKELADGLG